LKLINLINILKNKFTKPKRFSIIIECFFFLIIIGLSLYVLKTIILYGTAVTPDSIHYFDVSQNFSDGYGIVENTYSLGPEKFKPLTAWPPLYPIILSFFDSSYTSGSVEAARLSFIILPITIILMYLLLKQTTSKFVAFLFSVIFLFSHPILTVYSFAWSETIFINLILMALLASVLCIKFSSAANSPKHKFCILVLTVSIIFLPYCRIIGIIFFFIIPITFFLSKNRKPIIGYYIISCILYIVSIGILLARNYFHSGFWGGLDRKATSKGLHENIGDLLDAIQVQFLFSYEMLWISILAVLVSLAIKYFVKLESSTKQELYFEERKNIILITAGCLISYLLALLILRSISSFDAIDTRLISPAWPFVIIILAIIFSIGLDSRVHIFSALLLLGSTIFIFPIINQHIEIYNKVFTNLNNNQRQQLSSLGFKANNKVLYKDNSRGQNWATFKNMIYDLKQINGIDLLITEKPLEFQFLSGIRSRKFPSDNITDDTIKLINESADKGLILIMRQQSIQNLNSYYKFDFKKLNFNQNFYKKYRALLVPLPLPIMN
jgi:hypothetical protein